MYFAMITTRMTGLSMPTSSPDPTQPSVPKDHFPVVMNTVGWLLMVLMLVGLCALMSSLPRTIRRRRRMSKRFKGWKGERNNLIIIDDLPSDKPMSPAMMETLRRWGEKNQREPYHG